MASYLSSWLWSTSTPPQPPAAAASPSPSPPPPPPPPPLAPEQSPTAQSQFKRILRQLTIPAAGGAFLLLSLRATRRSTVRRFRATIPPYYHPNIQPPTNPPNFVHDAAEALQLATLNVLSFAILAVGGGAFALDVSSLDELREKFKTTEAGEGWEEQKKAAEEEFEEWVVGVLARKELKDKVKAEVARK